MWTFPATCACRATAIASWADLLAALKARADDGFKARAAERVKELAEEGPRGASRRPSGRQTAASRGRSARTIFARRWPRRWPSDIVLNEAIRNGPWCCSRCRGPEPGTLVGLAGGGLGFSGGMALGLKLAMPERTVVQIVGDGTFYFSNPQSALAVSGSTGCRCSPSCSTTPAGRGEGGDLARLPRGRGQGRQRIRRCWRPTWISPRSPKPPGRMASWCRIPLPSMAPSPAASPPCAGGRSAMLHAKVTRL